MAALIVGMSCAILVPGIGLSAPAPWAEIARQVAAAYVASLLPIALQSWLALRFASFALASGVGIGGVVVGLVDRR